MNLRLTKERILFQFLDSTTNGNFKNQTAWGFEFQRKEDEIKEARWGRVTKIGANVTQVAPGQYILIEPMMWTTGVDLDGSTYWATAEEKVLLVSDDHPK